MSDRGRSHKENVTRAVAVLRALAGTVDEDSWDALKPSLSRLEGYHASLEDAPTVEPPDPDELSAAGLRCTAVTLQHLTELTDDPDDRAIYSTGAEELHDLLPEVEA